MSDKTIQKDIKKELVDSKTDILNDFMNLPVPEVPAKAEEVPEKKKSIITIGKETSPNGVKKKRGRGRPRKEPVEEVPTQIISGDLLLMLVNVVLPRVFSMLHNMAVKDQKKHISANDLKLDDDEKKELKILADKAAKEVGFQGDPLTAFAISVIALMLVKMFA